MGHGSDRRGEQHLPLRRERWMLLPSFALCDILRAQLIAYTQLLCGVRRSVSAPSLSPMNPSVHQNCPTLLLSGRRVRAAAPYPPRKEGVPMSTRIYVGNLPFSATEEQLNDLFATYGAVSENTILHDRDSGQSKGFGFVQMDDDAAARTAIAALNGTMLGDRALRVNEAHARTARAGGSYPLR
jgi:hypothetical protein